ncbi:MAG TPA: hypothetical protein VF897_19860, partial [Roseiflexaceae bacterium]
PATERRVVQERLPLAPADDLDAQPHRAAPAPLRAGGIRESEAAVRQIEARIAAVQHDLEQRTQELTAAGETEQAAAARAQAQARLDRLQRVKERAESRLDAMRRQQNAPPHEPPPEGGADA